MITKTVVAPFVLALVAVLVPLATALGVLALGVLAAVVWMSAVYALLVRFGRRAPPPRFPVAERAEPLSRAGTRSP